MSGSLTIPHHIGSQSGPRMQAQTFDENFDAIADYINVREVTVGPVAMRPGPGVSGRWYWASDQNTLSLDNGVAWINVAGTGTPTLTMHQQLSAVEERLTALEQRLGVLAVPPTLEQRVAALEHRIDATAHPLVTPPPVTETTDTSNG